MRRLLSAAAVASAMLAAARTSAADEAPHAAADEPAVIDPAAESAAPGNVVVQPVESEDLGEEIGDQGIGGAIGAAAGGRVTPGGVRVTGHYLYQLAERDWFDGIASFTFGSGDAACFRDRGDDVVCKHGLAGGGAIEVAAGVRRVFGPRGRFRPFARAAVGISVVRFSDDDVTGVAIPLHLGGGLRTRLSPLVALVALADATLGIGTFGRGLGGEPQVGLAVTVGAEFRLR